MPKNFKSILEEVHKLKSLSEKAADKDLEDDEEDLEDDDLDPDDEGDDEESDDEDEDLDSLHGDSDTDYTADDLREIIDYCNDIIAKESDKDEDDEDGKKDDSMGEIGLELIYDYADLLPQPVINQIIEDLKEIFEIEDTMLESILEEGAVFVRARKGPAAKAAAKRARQYYKKNKSSIRKRNTAWRKSVIGKKLVQMHKKLRGKLQKVHNLSKGKKVVRIDLSK